MSTLFASGGTQVPAPQIQNQHQPWYRKLLQHNQSATWWAASCLPSSPQQLQLQLQEKYRLLKEKQKNCRQDWWTKRDGSFASLQESPPESSAMAQDLSHSPFSNDNVTWGQGPQQGQKAYAASLQLGSASQALWSSQQQCDIALSKLAKELSPHQYQQTEEGQRVWESSQAPWYDRELNLETLRQQEAMTKTAQTVKLQAELEQLIYLRERVKSRLLEMAQEHSQQAAHQQLREALLAKERKQQNLPHLTFASPYLESDPHLSPCHLQQSTGYRVGHEGAEVSFRPTSPGNYRQQLLQQYAQLRQNSSNNFDCHREDFHQLRAQISPAYGGRSPFVYHRQDEGHGPGWQAGGDAREKAKQQTPKQDMNQQLPWRNKDKIRPLPKSGVKPQHSSPRTSSVSEVIEQKDSHAKPPTDADKMSDHVVEQRRDEDISILSDDVDHSQTEERGHDNNPESQKEPSAGKSDQHDVIYKNKKEGFVKGDSSVTEQESSNESDLQHVLLVLSKDREKKREEDRVQAESEVFETNASSSAPLTDKESLTEEAELNMQSPEQQESEKNSDDCSRNKRSDRRGNKKRKEQQNAGISPQDTHADAQTHAPTQPEVKVSAPPKDQRPRNKYSSRRQQPKIGDSRSSSHEGDQPVRARAKGDEAGMRSELKMTHAQSHRQLERLQPYPRQREPREKRCRRDSQGEPFHQRRQRERWPGHQRYYCKSATAGRWREGRTDSLRKSEGSRVYQRSPKTPGLQQGKNVERQGDKERPKDPARQEVEDAKKTEKDEKRLPSTPLKVVQFDNQQQERSIDTTSRPDGALQCWEIQKTGKNEQSERRQLEDPTPVIVGSGCALEQRSGSNMAENIDKASNIKPDASESEEADIDLTNENPSPACKTPPGGASESEDSFGTYSWQTNEPRNISTSSPIAKTKNQHMIDDFSSDVGKGDAPPDRGPLPDTKAAVIQIGETTRDASVPATSSKMDSNALTGPCLPDEVSTSEVGLAPENTDMIALLSPTAQHKIESSFVKQIVFEFHRQDVQVDGKDATNVEGISRKDSVEMSVSSSVGNDEQYGENEVDRSMDNALQSSETSPGFREDVDSGNESSDVSSLADNKLKIEDSISDSQLEDTDNRKRERVDSKNDDKRERIPSRIEQGVSREATELAPDEVDAQQPVVTSPIKDDLTAALGLSPGSSVAEGSRKTTLETSESSETRELETAEQTLKTLSSLSGTRLQTASSGGTPTDRDSIVSTVTQQEHSSGLSVEVKDQIVEMEKTADGVKIQ